MQRPTVLGHPDPISLPLIFLSIVYFTNSSGVWRIVGEMFLEFIFSFCIARYWGRNSLIVKVSGVLEGPSEGFPEALGEVLYGATFQDTTRR